MSYQSVNPATGKGLKKFKEISNRPLETSLGKYYFHDLNK